MKCPQCGNILQSGSTVIFEHIKLIEYRCDICGYKGNKIIIKSGEKAKIFIKLIKSLYVKDIFKEILKEEENRQFGTIIERIIKSLRYEGFKTEEYNEIEHLNELREILINKLDENLKLDKPVKTILEEIKILDGNIQSAINRQNARESQNRVYIFEYDGADREKDNTI